MINGVSLRDSNVSYPTQTNKLAENKNNLDENQSGFKKSKADDVQGNNLVKNNEDVENKELENNPEAQSQIQQLVITEKKVIAHEQAHMSAGGEFTGSANYSYTVGPDGKRYITGGEVSISTPSVDNPEEKLRILERVRQAALAPAEPSSQDMSVASSASSQMGKVRAEIAAQNAEKAYGKEKTNKDLPNIMGKSPTKREAPKFEMTI